ncbi:hypothetical protein KKC15_02540 [bacterium]|nr:hypothetical protein [bacterium]
MILIFTLFASLVWANTISLSSVTEPKNILKQAKVYIDSENTHNFNYVLENNEKLFEKNEKDFLHLGYSPDAIWLKFSIKNDTNKKVVKVLEISNQMLDNIFLYTKQEDGSYSKEEKGVLYRKGFDDNILNFYFNIPLDAGELKEYYLKSASHSCALYFELTLMNKNELYHKEIHHQLLLTLFFGSIITLILYNLFIFYFTKDLAYLYYVSYLTFAVLNHLSYTTFSLYIYPYSFLKLDSYLAILYLSFISIFSLLFVREFLNIKRYKKIDYVLKLFFAISVVFILFTSPEFYPLDLVVLISLLSLVYILCVSFYLLYKGEENAKYMFVGWSISILGWIMLGAYDSGMWSLLYDYPYFFEFAIFTEAILFSVALANRLNKTKGLEKSIKTNEILTKELHHRVKNNMQFILSMYRLKLAKFSNRDIANSLKEVEGTIQAMSATHEMLYAQKAVEHIDANTYLKTLISKLKQSYATSEIDIKLKVQTTLNIDNSLYVGIILNELLTNSFKYAFKQNKGKILILLSQHNHNYELVVADNGVGFDIKQDNDTFGIELVKTLVTDELKGKLSINTDEGTKYTITWS